VLFWGNVGGSHAGGSSFGCALASCNGIGIGSDVRIPASASDDGCGSRSADVLVAGDARGQGRRAQGLARRPQCSESAAEANAHGGHPVDPSRRLAIRRVDLPPGVKLVALTFDLCEQPHEIAGYQGAIVDYLRAERVKATFFAGGKWMLTHRDRTQQLMSDPLFEIGNHSWEHRNLRLLRGSALVSEIENTQVSYEQVREELGAKQCLGFDGRRPPVQGSPARLSLFRFPFGACDDASLEAVGHMGLKAIQWDVSSGDPWIGQTPERMTRAVLAGVKPGSIVLFHANGRGWHTAEAVRSIIPALKAKGYRFVTVTELLDSGKPVYSRTCYDSRPGDTDRYGVVAQRLNGQPVRQKAKADTGFHTEVLKQPW
jgi:peptidoglycan/xylan/chitin deacetylase (PgdA/CDA1 family)